MGIRRIHSGRLSVGVLRQGASLIDLRACGVNRNLVLGFSDPADHHRIPIYAGAIIGPVANRIRGGVVDLGDVRYRMPCNEAGRTALHSGPGGTHARIWDVVSHEDTALSLRCVLPDGACGLPGRRVITATYALRDRTLTLTLTARTDRATVINLAAHPYWNLDGTDTLARHRLRVFAHRVLPTDADHLPTGQISDLEGHPFDFRQDRPLPLDPGLDLNFCLSKTLRPVPYPAAELTGVDGIRLTLATTAPGLQVYNGAHLPARTGILSGGRDLAPFGALALEPQHWPDAPAHGHFPSILLRPDTQYRQVSTYRIDLP